MVAVIGYTGQFARMVKGCGLKIHCRQLRAGSNPAADTMEQHLALLEHAAASRGDQDQPCLRIAERGFDPRTFGL